MAFSRGKNPDAFNVRVGFGFGTIHPCVDDIGAAGAAAPRRLIFRFPAADLRIVATIDLAHRFLAISALNV